MYKNFNYTTTQRGEPMYDFPGRLGSPLMVRREPYSLSTTVTKETDEILSFLSCTKVSLGHGKNYLSTVKFSKESIKGEVPGYH